MPRNLVGDSIGILLTMSARGPSSASGQQENSPQYRRCRATGRGERRQTRVRHVNRL